MRILVTGGNGYLGQHVIRNLLQDNHQPIEVGYTYRREPLNEADVGQPLAAYRVDFCAEGGSSGIESAVMSFAPHGQFPCLHAGSARTRARTSTHRT